jgi:WD40-like Beta Propeller Repeat
VITGLEQRLRAELRVLADQVGAEDLRPLRRPYPAAGVASAHWLGPVAAMVAIAILTGGLMVARNALHAHAAPSATALFYPPDPGVIAVAGSGPTGRWNAIKLISVSDGKVVRDLPLRETPPGSGLALLPDGSAVFVATGNARLSSLSVATGRSISFGPGQSPSVSPDSKYLAYATGEATTKLAIRNLSTGQTRRIDLSGVLGANSSLEGHGSIAWLGDGTQVIAVPQPAAVVGSPAASGSVSGRSTACGEQDSPRGLCLIVVDIGKRLSPHLVFVPGVSIENVFQMLGADLTASRAFFVSEVEGTTDMVSRVTITRGKAVTRELAPVPGHDMAFAISPDGDRVAYQGSESAVFIGTIRHGRITSSRGLLNATNRFIPYQVSW